MEKKTILKSWSWKEAEFDFKWVRWNERIVSGHFTDLCLDYDGGVAVKTCLEEMSWNFNIKFNFKEGIFSESLAPLKVRSELISIKLKKTPPAPEDESPPDIWGYWKTIWSPVVPDFDFNFKEIRLTTDENKKMDFDLQLLKKGPHLTLETLGFNLAANPEEFEVVRNTPYRIPSKAVKKIPIYLRNFKLTGTPTRSRVPLEATGDLEFIHIFLKATLDLPLENSFNSVPFRKDFLKSLSGILTLNDFQKNIRKVSPLPAPFNVMDGSIVTKITSTDASDRDSILLKSNTHVDLKSAKQVLDLILFVDTSVDVKNFHPESVLVNLGFNKVTLQLPRISKKSLPPQFMPDGRIQDSNASKKMPKKSGEDIDLSVHLSALNEQALHLKTNLLDEELRLNFDLLVNEGHLEKGYVESLPLKTKIFKRPVRVKTLRVNFNFPLVPVVESIILFPLPEYKITLNLAGPLSKPHYSFSSVPPLPQNDIYSVLLFGKPMSELEPDDKTAAQKTTKILSQGVLSLSVLYFLAGSPVEYLGYDPSTNSATAQIGIGSRSSLRVSGGQGAQATGIRHSLGNGWYLDTSAQSNSPNTSNEADRKSYGVMLERIIAY